LSKHFYYFCHYFKTIAKNSGIVYIYSIMAKKYTIPNSQRGHRKPISTEPRKNYSVVLPESLFLKAKRAGPEKVRAAIGKIE